MKNLTYYVSNNGQHTKISEQTVYVHLLNTYGDMGWECDSSMRKCLDSVQSLMENLQNGENISVGEFGAYIYAEITGEKV